VAKTTTTIVKKFAEPVVGVPGGGGADSPSQTSGFLSYNSASFVVISNELAYTIPTGQTTATVTVNLSAMPNGPGAGAWNHEAKMQRKIAGVWTDQGTTFTAADSATVIDGEETYKYPALLVFTKQSTGLTAGVQELFRIVARTTVAKNHAVTGSISVVSP